MKFLEIGTDQDQVHFLLVSVREYSVTKIVTTINSHGMTDLQAVSISKT